MKKYLIKKLPILILYGFTAIILFLLSFRLFFGYYFNPVTIVSHCKNNCQLDINKPKKLNYNENYLEELSASHIIKHRIDSRLNKKSCSQIDVLYKDYNNNVIQSPRKFDTYYIAKKPIKKIYALIPRKIISVEFDIIIDRKVFKINNINNSLFNITHTNILSGIDNIKNFKIVDITPIITDKSVLYSRFGIINGINDILIMGFILVLFGITLAGMILIRIFHNQYMKLMPNYLIECKLPKLFSTIGLLVAIVPVLIFNIIIYDKCFPITEGWWSYIASLILEGKIPYKDFYLYLPPVYPYIISFFVKIFGIEIIKLRLMGIALELLITILLYACLRQLFNPIISSLCTVFSMFVFQTSFLAFNTYDYNQVAILLAFLIIYLILKSDSSEQLRVLMAILSGFFSVILILTKQSTGLILTISIIAGFLVIYLKDKKYKKTIIFYIMSLLIGIILFILVLYYFGILRLFIDNVFIGAANSKGGNNFFTVFIIWLPRLLIQSAKFKLKSFFIFIISMICLLIINKYLKQKIKQINPTVIIFLFFITVSLAVILPYSFYSISEFMNSCWYFKFVHIIIVLISTAVIMSLMISLPLVRYNSNSFIIIICLSFAMLMNTAISTEIIPYGTIPAISLIMGFFIEKSKNSFIFIFFIFVIAFYVSAGVSNKYHTPYNWWGSQCGDVRGTIPHDNIQIISKLKIDPKINDLVKVITNKCEVSSGINTAFCFPNIPIFYLITNTKSVTFAPIHWYDVASDSISEYDASILSINLPDIIFWNRDINNNDISFHESLFRNGKSAGQRKIIELLERLTKNRYNYFLLTQLKADENIILQVWIKNKYKI